jgi:PAS domain S-box-containing protein
MDDVDSKETSRQLANERDRYRAIFQSMAEPAFVVDHSFQIITVNRAFERLVGTGEYDVRGKKCRDVFNYDLCVACPLAEAMRGKTSFADVEASMSVSGNKKTVLVSGSYIEDHAAAAPGGIVVIQDITERKQREEAEEKVRLLAAEQKAILDNIASGVFLLKDRVLKWANRKAAEVFGYPLEEIVGKETSMFYPDRESFEQLGREAYPLLAQGKAYSLERKMKKKNGELIWCSIVGQAVNALDLEQGTIWLLDDITERKTAEQHLQLLHKAVSTSQAGITFRDTNNIIIFTNDAEARMHGYDKSELTGRPAHILSPPDLREDMNVEKMTRIAGWERERTSIRKDGTTFPVHLVSDVVKDELGNPLGLVTICEDITERKKVEEELTLHKNHLEDLVRERTAEFVTAINFLQDEIESRKLAEETLRENEAKMRHLHGMKVLGELAAGVAHEVRNPLHALMSVTEALKKELGENSDHDIFLFHIREQVERLSVLMKDLLDLGKPIEPSHLRPESLADICLASIDLWKKSPSRRDHSISFVKPAADNVIVTGDGQRLQQVFLNLLENAAHHSPEGSEIQVLMTVPDEDSVSVKVIDKGSGVPEEILPRIFEPFFTTRRKGTGLGLSIIKNILEGHGGSVVVRNNNPLPGCTAEVNLPSEKEAKK